MGMSQFLQLVWTEERRCSYCHRGADRTGMMTAIYRVAVQGWTKEQAIAEMTQGGFGFYSGWRNLVRYIRDLDIERLK
jgi:protein tyrosine/serine phosphatase